MPHLSSPGKGPKPGRGFLLFAPILAGATLRERMIACLGALTGIGLTELICGWLFGGGPHAALIVAPVGASAVLLFAVPASPLAQPWPIIGGNTISALVGVAVARLVPDPMLAIGAGVSLAIAAMSLTRCLHPPGGAAALTAIIGGPAVTASGFLFPFVPVALNSLILVGLGIVFHRACRRIYPHVTIPAPVNPHHTLDPPSQQRAGFRAEDIDAALAALKETFDIDRDDLDRLLRQVELQALMRSHGRLPCADIMSRDVIGVGREDTAETARALLLAHNIRTLPVMDGERRLIGTVGLRELALAAGRMDGLLSGAATASPNDPALGLLPVLTDGRTHAVMIVDDDRKVLGLISQTDLLGAMARFLLVGTALEERPVNRSIPEDRHAY